MNIWQKLIEVRKEVPYLQKENAGQQYKYVSSSQVLGNCKKKMDELGLLLIPAVISHKVSESVIEKMGHDGFPEKRTTTYFTELDMSFTWVNAEKPEETIACTWYGQGVDIAGEKGVGKAMTYAEKYFLLKFFNIATDKDDPDSFQRKMDDEPEPPRQAPRPASPQRPPQSHQARANSKADQVITEAQNKRLFAISRANNVPTDKLKELIAKTGKAHSKDLNKKEYDEICAFMEQYKPAPEPDYWDAISKEIRIEDIADEIPM